MKVPVNIKLSPKPMYCFLIATAEPAMCGITSASLRKNSQKINRLPIVT